VWTKRKETRPWFKVFITVAVILICMATAFVKQHSVVDIFAAIPVCLLAEWLVYGKRYRQGFFKKQ